LDIYTPKSPKSYIKWS